MKNCKDLKLDKKYFEEIENEMINKDYPYFCIPEEFKLGISGIFGSSDFAIVNLIIEPCTNSTANNNSCLPKSIIDSEPSIFAHIILKNSLIDPPDYKAPLKRSWLNNVVQFKPNTERVQMYTYQRIEVFSDGGFLLEDININKGYRLVKEYDELFYVPNTTRLLFIRFGNSRFYIKINRSYLKIQEIAANIGGILNLFWFLIIIIGEKYSHFKYLKSLIKKFQEKCKDNIHRTENNKFKILDIKSSNINSMDKKDASVNVMNPEIDNSKLILKNNVESVNHFKNKDINKEENPKSKTIDKIIDEKFLEDLINNKISRNINSKKVEKVISIENFFKKQEINIEYNELNDTNDFLSMISQFFPDFMKTDNSKLFINFDKKLLQWLSIENYLDQLIEHKLMMNVIFSDSNEFKEISEKIKCSYGCIH